MNRITWPFVWIPISLSDRSAVTWLVVANLEYILFTFVLAAHAVFRRLTVPTIPDVNAGPDNVVYERRGSDMGNRCRCEWRCNRVSERMTMTDLWTSVRDQMSDDVPDAADFLQFSLKFTAVVHARIQ